MCKSLKQVINFQGDGPCLGTWNKESKQYTWLSYNQVGSSFFSLHSFFILFFCNCCKKYLIITIKKPGHRLKNKKGREFFVFKLNPSRLGGEEAWGRGDEGAWGRGGEDDTFPLHPTEVWCSVLLKPLVSSVMVTRYPLNRDTRSIYLWT